MYRSTTRTASLLAAAALLVGASPALAAPRHDHAPARPAPLVHVDHGAPAVVPSRIRLVTMPG